MFAFCQCLDNKIILTVFILLNKVCHRVCDIASKVGNGELYPCISIMRWLVKNLSVFWLKPLNDILIKCLIISSLFAHELLIKELKKRIFPI